MHKASKCISMNIRDVVKNTDSFCGSRPADGATSYYSIRLCNLTPNGLLFPTCGTGINSSPSTARSTPLLCLGSGWKRGHGLFVGPVLPWSAPGLTSTRGVAMHTALRASGLKPSLSSDIPCSFFPPFQRQFSTISKQQWPRKGSLTGFAASYRRKKSWTGSQPLPRPRSMQTLWWGPPQLHGTWLYGKVLLILRLFWVLF